MFNEYCVEHGNSIPDVIEGEAVKVLVISFLGDIDKDRGIIISSDSKCLGCSIVNKILVIERFRGSTVGTYILYSLCKKGLAPKAIVCLDPDPVVIAGATLCGIPMIYGIPKHILQQISTGDRIKVYLKGGKVCLSIEKVF